MKVDTWINEMIKDIESENPTKKEPQEVQLSESALDSLADIMIKKMENNNFDVETSKPDQENPEQEKPQPTKTKEGETILD